MFLDLASHLDSRRFRSLALLAEEGWLSRKLQERGVQTFLVTTPGLSHPWPLAAMARLIRREGVSLIHAHLPDQNFYACLAGCLTGRPTVVTYHGEVERSRAAQRLKLWFVARCAAAAVGVSRYIAGSLCDAAFPPDRVLCIYNGIELDRFQRCAPGRVRAELGCSPTTRLVGMIANQRQGKGYDYFVQAARLIANQVPECRFLAVGEMDSTSSAQLSALVRQLSLQDQFSFLGFREDVPEIVNDLDVFVLSSVSEGFSLVSIEAMAASKPVVVARSGGPEEIVEHGSTGFLVPPADVQGLASTVCHALQQPEQMKAIGLRARQSVERRFSLPRMVQEYEELYQRCLTPHPS